MPRQARPRWHKGRRQWYANVGERGPDGRAREVFAPAAIGERDEGRAWEWFEAERKRRETAAPPSEVTAEWVAEHYLAAAEKRRDEGRFQPEQFANQARHLGIFADALGARVAATLGPDDLTRLGEHLLSLYSPAYARNVLATVRQAFGWAVREKLLPASPIKGYKAPTLPRSPVRFAERAEAAAFLGFWRAAARRDTIRGRYERLTLLLERALIRTGARPKELCVLRWSDIDWRGWTSAAGHRCAKAVIPPDRWKAGKATGKPRTIYFTPALTRALARVRDRGGARRESVFVHGAGRAGAGAGEPWPSGSRLSRAILRVRRRLIAWQAGVRGRIEAGDRVEPWERRRAEVPVQDEGHNRLVNYRWRHTAISTLLMLGVDVPTVAELTGTSPEMIYRHYGHLLDAHLAAAADKLAGARKAR
jgi:integrase